MLDNPLDAEDGWIPGAGIGTSDEPPSLVYSNVEGWVTGYLAPHIRRRLGGAFTWCPWWWRHAEAISRLTALWTAWEHLRNDGALGMSQWWIYHADPHLAVLLSKDSGPFASCKPDRHTDIAPLPCEPAPAGLLAVDAFSEPEDL